MNAFTLRGRTTILRLQKTVERNIARRHAQQTRFESTKPQSPAETRKASAPTSTFTTSISSIASWPWLSPLLVPFQMYGRAHRRLPLTVQALSTTVIYFCGDLSAQAIATSGFQEGSGYEVERAVRSVIIGAIMSIPGYKYFLFLGRNFNYFSSHMLNLGIKIIINQTCFTPLFNTYFFGMQSLLAGATLEDAWIRVKETVPVSWKNSWKVWPAVTAFSFTYVSPEYRSIFAGLFAIGWQSYLSWLNKKAETKEKANAALESGAAVATTASA